MSRIHQRLGYGYVGDVELDPFVQLMSGQPAMYQEIRMDKPDTWNNTYEYIGIADSGSSTSDNVWGILRKTWVNTKATRFQYLGSVAWDNRVTLPWPT